MTRPKAPENREGKPRTAVEPAKPGPTAIAPGSPPPPAPATLGPEGSLLWEHLWRVGVNAYAPDTDRFILERYCSLSERRATLQRIVDVEGWTAVGSTGNIVAHPAAKLLHDVEAKLLPLEDRLGLSPESRIRLNILTHTETKSALEAFLASDD